MMLVSPTLRCAETKLLLSRGHIVAGNTLPDIINIPRAAATERRFRHVPLFERARGDWTAFVIK